MTELRWELAEEPKAQGSLFGEPVFEREPGRGEFRGMEFLHVRAHRIINEVRNAPFGFRYTINAYRGCSHACSYCLSGETPILMADGRTKPLADVRAGDVVYGTVRRGAYRRYVPSTVLDHWSTVKPACRVTLEDGTELIASGDHRFLTERGWKHVTGAEQGTGRRPHLTTNNSLLGVGAFAEPPKSTADYRRGYLCGLIRGDGHLGSYSYDRPGRANGDVHRFRLALIDHEPLQRGRQYLDDCGVATDEYLFQMATGPRQEMRAIRTQRRAGVAAITELVRWPAAPSDDWRKGFLAGIFDAEGSYSRGILRISNCDDAIIDQIESCLGRFGFRHVVEDSNRPNRIRYVRLTGGLREHLRFFHLVDPATTRKRTIDGTAIKSDAALRVVAIEPLGIDIPMFDITTETGDFIANGVVSHNCFARPSHTYLELDADRDFERRIVVKVNAVSLLRRELDPRRWRGELIAMGTNTDPYQRAEGKYRLTRGVVEVLTEFANPFSILTKSTLVLRDLSLLAEAAKRTSVRVNLSIGTLDEEVWRATEPGTPHPMRRVRAVEKLNEAGIPCGVLMAPVLPELSDRPEQLEAVVKACVDAGAQSISTVLLHLRPGVKDVFFSRLAESHPHLIPTYRRRYRDRAYAPSADQQALDVIVRDLVRTYGGTAAERGDPEHLTGRERPVGVPKRRAAGGAGNGAETSGTDADVGADVDAGTQLSLL
jgi:DNA repair photolyase